ncbi:MAG TPA: hypothetical protein VE325_11390 [Burkholderiales bacterium]|nr:hypothetical protein [Burkholderiales bacterium]
MKRTRPAGSLTSANEVVDSVELPPDPDPDQVLDAAVAYTFPASDPIAVDSAFRHALCRQEKKQPPK